ncbi:MAG TPA: presenilin family intramembrane aspartyl protease [Methanocorpusculum sp.]|nr:presenilin family intramembrane aspartyl protease [Methanocorpusculum sp.]
MSSGKVEKYASYMGMVILMIVTFVISLLMIIPVDNAGLIAFEDPNSMLNIVIFIIAMLFFTFVLLALIKWKAQKLITVLIGFSIGLVLFYVVFALLSYIINGVLLYIISAVCAAALVILLYLYPEWYVIDSVGILASAGCASIFGISLSIYPVIVLLVLLMVYDYISVKRSKHMLKLADGVMKQKMQIMFVVPRSPKYSFRKSNMSMTDETGERNAYMLGMGDIIIPAILLVSAQFYAGGDGVMSILGCSLPAVGVFIGAALGLLIVLINVNKKGPQPGLPYINGCAIIGFLICCAVSGSWAWVTAPIF